MWISHFFEESNVGENSAPKASSVELAMREFLAFKVGDEE